MGFLIPHADPIPEPAPVPVPHSNPEPEFPDIPDIPDFSNPNSPSSSSAPTPYTTSPGLGGGGTNCPTLGCSSQFILTIGPFRPNCDNSSALTIGEPTFLQDNPGRVCAVSTDFSKTSNGTDVFSPSISSSTSNSTSSENSTSIFQSCCGAPNIKASTANFTLPSYNTTIGRTCGYSYCNVSDQGAADAFEACLLAKAVGVRGECFVSTASARSSAGTEVTSGAVRRGGKKRETMGLGLLIGFMVGVAGLGGL